MSYIDRTGHIRKFGGDIWYVNTGTGDDANGGQRPNDAFATIGKGILDAAAGDAISVKAGVYDEAGLDMSLAGLELWCESGVFIVDTTPGTCLVVSGNACVVFGAHFVQAGAAGLQVTGVGTIVENCISVNCTVGFDINEHSTQLFRCVAAGCTVTQFDIGERNTVLRNCFAAGTGAATRGFYLSNAVVMRCLLDRCDSVGNATAGFEIVTGASNNSLANCTSGGGDGDVIDEGTETSLWVEDHDSKERHEAITPMPNGEGVAGNPINVHSQVADETGIDSTMNYYGDAAILIAPGTITTEWFFLGVNLFAITASDDQRFHCYRIVNLLTATRNGGNAWNAGATALTVQSAAEAALFEVDDMVWIRTPGYKPNGEIVKVTDVTGAVITIARNVENSGRTGLHWNYTTNDGGNEVMYLAERESSERYHETQFDYAAASAKDFHSNQWTFPRRMSRNDGLVVRMINGTDAANSQCGITTVWSD